MKMWKLETQHRVILSMSAYQKSKETVGHYYFEGISVVFFLFFFFCLYVGLYTLPMSNFIKIRLFKGRIIFFLLIAGST